MLFQGFRESITKLGAHLIRNQVFDKHLVTKLVASIIDPDIESFHAYKLAVNDQRVKDKTMIKPLPFT